MKKHLIALAVAAAVAAPAAMADTTLYGLAHISLDYIDNDQSTATRDSGNLNVQSASSRLGVKGTEKISKDLSALYQMEFAVDMTDNSSGTISARNQFVGLTGGFGTAILGRHDTPMKLAIAQYDLFGDQIGDNGNIVGAKFGTSAGWNLRAPNVVAYITPNFSGFSATLAYVTDHELGTNNAFNDDHNKNDAYSLSAGYKHKMFDVTAAYEHHNLMGANPPSLDEKSWFLGAGVNFGGLRVNALYQDIENFNNLDGVVYGGGVAYKFGNHTLKAQYFKADVAGSASKILGVNGQDPSMWALGYDYKLSKQTDLYAAYAAGENGQAVWRDGHGGATTCAATADCSAFSVGVKHKF
ncbi:MAG: porin [Halothiobacillaceae bacterium]